MQLTKTHFTLTPQCNSCFTYLIQLIVIQTLLFLNFTCPSRFIVCNYLKLFLLRKKHFTIISLLHVIFTFTPIKCRHFIRRYWLSKLALPIKHLFIHLDIASSTPATEKVFFMGILDFLLLCEHIWIQQQQSSGVNRNRWKNSSQRNSVFQWNAQKNMKSPVDKPRRRSVTSFIVNLNHSKNIFENDRRQPNDIAHRRYFNLPVFI